jgi:DNA-directed RNA polymerase subunit L
MNLPLTLASNQTALQLVQKNFSLLKLGGAFFIIDELELASYFQGSIEHDISFYNERYGKILIERFLTNQPVPGIPKEVFAQFLSHPNTQVYSEIKFHPKKQPKHVLNLWVPPTIEPINTNCNTIIDFIFSVISSKENLNNEYLLNYLAHLYQKPEEKPGIMVALMSPQGCGKGVMMQILGKIWGRTTLMINDIEDITGRFNLCLERKLLICMDEAMYVNDSAGQEKLKNLITEPTINVEAKHQMPRTVNSLHRFFLTTNHEHFLKTSKDDRRLFAIPISESRQNDHAYFNRLLDVIENTQELNGFVYFLKHRDISNFNIRLRPKTQFHALQIIQSLQKVDRWVYEILNNKKIGYTNWDSELYMSLNDLKKAYCEFDSRAQQYETIQNENIRNSFKKLLPKAIQHRVADSRGFNMPNINTARLDFERIVGMKIDWAIMTKDDSE